MMASHEHPFNPDILLIDINGLGYAAMYSPLANLEHNGFETGGIHGAINSLFARMAQRPGAVPFVLWDNHAQWRYDALPDYKGSRKGDDGSEKRRIRDSYKKQMPCIQMMLSVMGIPQISCAATEADDLAGIICRQMDPSWKIELTSKDTDWWQALDERTVWYSPLSKKELSLSRLSDPKNEMKDGHFLSTDEYLEAKALSGDASDEIPGINGVGLLTATKIIRKYGVGIKDFWRLVDAGEVTPKGVVETRVASLESREIFERNVYLMDWRRAPEPDLSNLALTAGHCDFDVLEIEANELGLKKVLSRAKEALAPWRKGWGPAIGAVDAALNHRMCLPVANRGKEEPLAIHSEESEDISETPLV